MIGDEIIKKMSRVRCGRELLGNGEWILRGIIIGFLSIREKKLNGF